MGNRNLAALAVAGSVGAGIADRFSDLELDCYWVRPPTDTDRLTPVRALGGQLTALWDYDQDDEEWSEDYLVGELGITVSNFLVSSVERFLDDVVIRASTDPVRHMRLAALQRCRVGELPAGTVTMLFSDIEGSTVLLSRLGDRYGEALSAHRVMVRAAIAAWGGREISTEGDSFFVVFGSAADAVAAQRALAGHDWPGGDAVRVRMGLHSGEPTPHEDNYIGMDVHRAARIAATAHGGQVVLSEATAALAAPLPDGVSVRDLGFHRLKDIAVPERIYQLAGPGLREDFPRLKSLGTQTSLPVPATPLIGRDEDLERLRAGPVPARRAAGHADRHRGGGQDPPVAGRGCGAGDRVPARRCPSSRWPRSVTPT